MSKYITFRLHLWKVKFGRRGFFWTYRVATPDRDHLEAVSVAWKEHREDHPDSDEPVLSVEYVDRVLLVAPE